MGFSNSEALAVLKWMVRTRLMATMYESDPRAEFDRKINDDFAELMEAGVITYAEVTHGEEGIISVRLHRKEERFVFSAAAVDGCIKIERRAVCV